MRFNRVLLLAASINLAVLATVFTISCSGDKGSKGEPGAPGLTADDCAIEGGRLVCAGQDIGPVGGGAGGGDCEIVGQKLICGGNELNFGIVGCNVNQYKGRDETVQVNCSGQVFGLCFGVPYEFDVSFCDQGEVTPLPSCEGVQYNPNDGQACVDSKTLTQCDEKDFYWTLSTSGLKPGGVYSKCGVDLKYRECRDASGEVVGEPFFIGRKQTVSDVITSTPDGDGFIDFENLAEVSEYEGTKYCKNANTAAAAISDCAEEFGEGYVPDHGLSDDPTKDTRAFTSCKLKANYAICTSGSISVGAFDARTHICQDRGTASATRVSCAELNGGIAQFVPMPGEGISGQLARQQKGFNECGLDPRFGVCNDLYNVIGVYAIKTQVCKDAGRTGAAVETCGPGLIPDAANRECLMGELECARREGYWDANKQSCFRNAQASCYENNTVKSTCRYFYKSAAEQGWSTDGESTGLVSGEINKNAINYCGPSFGEVAGNANGLGRWTASAIANAFTTTASVTRGSTDKYFDPAGNDGKGACYANYRAYCDDGNGLWTANVYSTQDPNEGGARACKRVVELNEYECVSNKDKGYFWGGLLTVNNVNESDRFCSVNEVVAKATCEQAVGNYEQDVAAQERLAIGATGWHAGDKECIRLFSANDLVKSFSGSVSCSNSGYFWDVGIEKCFVDIGDAKAACAIADGKMASSGFGSSYPAAGDHWNTNSCSKATASECKTGNFSNCATNSGTCPAANSQASAPACNCVLGGFFWDPFAVQTQTIGGATVTSTVPKCVQSVANCAMSNGIYANGACKGEKSQKQSKCEDNTLTKRLYEVEDGDFGLNLGDCVTKEICVSAGGYYNEAAKTCSGECGSAMDPMIAVSGTSGSTSFRECAATCGGISISGYEYTYSKADASGNQCGSACDGSAIEDPARGEKVCVEDKDACMFGTDGTNCLKDIAACHETMVGEYSQAGFIDDSKECVKCDGEQIGANGRCSGCLVNGIISTTVGALCDDGVAKTCNMGKLELCTSASACLSATNLGTSLNTFWDAANATCSRTACASGEEVVKQDGSEYALNSDPSSYICAATCTAAYPEETFGASGKIGRCVSGAGGCTAGKVASTDNTKCADKEECAEGWSGDACTTISACKALAATQSDKCYVDSAKEIKDCSNVTLTAGHACLGCKVTPAGGPPAAPGIAGDTCD